MNGGERDRIENKKRVNGKERIKKWRKKIHKWRKINKKCGEVKESCMG